MLNSNCKIEINDELEQLQWEEDAWTIQAVLSGDVDYFEKLVDKYRKLVFSIVGKLIPDQDVETVAQDVFLRAFHSLSKYSYSKPFQHWLTTIAFASCCDFWREEKKRNRNSELDQPSPESIEWIEQAIMNWPLSGEELQAHRNESLEILEYALKQVNPKDRLVIELTLLDDCSMKKAAKKLGWSIINVKVRAMKARRKLRKVISKLLKLKEN